jgi:hydrogenase maturation protease
MSPILVAGIGNIFNGDDGFGVAVAQRLAGRPLPAGVTVKDFGIRGLDLTYALLDGYAAAILVDTAQRGGPPGTVYVIEPEAASTADPQPEDLLLSPHELDPARVLRLAMALGSRCRRVVLVACEPASFGDEELGAMELTPPVAAAIDPAVDLVEQVITQLLAEENPPWITATHPSRSPAAPSSPTDSGRATGS